MHVPVRRNGTEGTVLSSIGRTWLFKRILYRQQFLTRVKEVGKLCAASSQAGDLTATVKHTKFSCSLAAEKEQA